MGKQATGSAEVWDEIFSRNDSQFSDTPITQNQVFEHVKIHALKKIFPKKAPCRILEVGSGSGFASLYFAKRGYDVTLLDINEGVLKIAKKNFQKEKARGKFIVGDATRLPFPPKSFDVVMSHGLLEHFSEPDVPIKEMSRVLKKQGIFFADIVPSRFSCQSFGNIFNICASTFFWSLKGYPQKGIRRGLRNIRPVYFESDLGWKEWRRIISSAGIKKIKVRGNRPFPRLTLPATLDRIYGQFLKLFISPWQKFDSSGSVFSLFWGAGFWFWGVK